MYQKVLKKGEKVTKKMIFPSKNEQKHAKNEYFRVISALKPIVFYPKNLLFDHKKALFRVKSVLTVPLVPSVSVVQ